MSPMPIIAINIQTACPGARFKLNINYEPSSILVRWLSGLDDLSRLSLGNDAERASPPTPARAIKQIARESIVVLKAQRPLAFVLSTKQSTGQNGTKDNETSHKSFTRNDLRFFRFHGQ